jgi:hypothetical protein
MSSLPVQRLGGRPPPPQQQLPLSNGSMRLPPVKLSLGMMVPHLPLGHRQQEGEEEEQQQQQGRHLQEGEEEDVKGPCLKSVFDYEEEEDPVAVAEHIPSPPPLPADFDNSSFLAAGGT